jgi:DNA invertase Pin-like site-specific DNA recombinase
MSVDPEPETAPAVTQFSNSITPQVNAPPPSKLRLVGYIRVSTDRQAELGFGVEVQERAIRHWAKLKGHRVVAFARDEGHSGANGIEARTGLADALELVRLRRVDGVVVYRLDRLARDLVLQEQLIAELRRLSSHLFSTADGESAYLTDDDADPSRRLIRQILGAVAEYERSLIRMRMLAGKRRKQLAGRKSVGAYAFGTQPCGQGRERDAGPRPVEQAAIRRMIELRRSGASFRGIAVALDREELPPRRALNWSPSVVRRILQREGGLDR